MSTSKPRNQVCRLSTVCKLLGNRLGQSQQLWWWLLEWDSACNRTMAWEIAKSRAQLRPLLCLRPQFELPRCNSQPILKMIRWLHSTKSKSRPCSWGQWPSSLCYHQLDSSSDLQMFFQLQFLPIYFQNRTLKSLYHYYYYYFCGF